MLYLPGVAEAGGGRVAAAQRLLRRHSAHFVAPESRLEHADRCSIAIDHLLMVLLSKQLRFGNSFREDFRLWSCRANRASSFSSERNCHKVSTSSASDGMRPPGTAPSGPPTCSTYLEWLREAVGASRPARGSCADTPHILSPQNRGRNTLTPAVLRSTIYTAFY